MSNPLDNILAEWEIDGEINDMALDEETRRIPNLHQKYLKHYSKAKLRGKKLDKEFKTLLKDKWLYYNGKMHKDEIEEKGWAYDPFNGLTKPLKGDMNYYYDADTDIQNMQLKIDYNKELVDTLKEIIDAIRWRHQHIRNMIDWKRFTSGN